MGRRSASACIAEQLPAPGPGGVSFQNLGVWVSTECVSKWGANTPAPFGWVFLGRTNWPLSGVALVTVALATTTPMGAARILGNPTCHGIPLRKACPDASSQQPQFTSQSTPRGAARLGCRFDLSEFRRAAGGFGQHFRELSAGASPCTFTCWSQSLATLQYQFSTRNAIQQLGHRGVLIVSAAVRVV